jgi:AcrR family transcriptional regulator
MENEVEIGLRDRKKVRVRQALADAAMQLFEARGFDAVTVDEIAAAADVSRRTFFRYFPTKEAAVFARREDQLATFRVHLMESTADAPFDVMRGALLSLIDDYHEQREHILRGQRVIRSAPSLMTHDVEVDRAFEAVIVEYLAQNSRRTVADRRRARMLAAMMVGAVRVVIEEWGEKNGEPDLKKLAQEALELLEPLAPRPK